MAETPKTNHSKIRTFAQDLNSQREKRGLPTTANEKKPLEEVQMAKAPSATTEQPITPPKPAPIISAPTPVAPPEPKPKAEPKNEPALPVAAPTPKKSIPSFHDLQAEVTSIQEGSMQKASAHSEPKKEAIVARPRMNVGYDSTVITDTKHKRFKLFPAIGAALASWFASFKPAKKNTPTISVPDANRRKGVIQKATSKTGSMFSADDADLKEKIRLRKLREEEARQAEIAAQEHDPETTWSPFTETGYELLDEPHEAAVIPTKNVTIEYKKQRDIPVQPTVAAEPQTEAVTEDTRWNAEPSTPQPITEPTVTQPKADPVAMEPTAVPVQTSVRPPKKQAPFNPFSRYSTNTLIVASLIVVTVGVLVTSITVLFINQPDTEVLSEPIATNPQSIANATQNTITLNSENTAVTLVKQPSTTNLGIIETELYYQDGTKVPASVVPDLLNFKLLTSFKQALTNVDFVYVNQSKPVMLFTFVDVESVQGGFLNWETNMLADLRAMYDLPFEQPTAFVDQTVGGSDVRVLVSESGQTLIVYGITTDNTAIISNSLADFAAVQEAKLNQ